MTNMRNVTINLPDIYVKNLAKLQRLGCFPSRSEGVRYAVREFLEKEKGNLKLLGYFEWKKKNEKEKKENVF